ncbi:MAG: dihydroneopterin aldolase, partial [Sediminibacterium sp.]|nr:dihydroneopterin aldolase [Sediminibacterium sp.]
MCTLEFNFNLFGYHGLYEEETILGNEFNIIGIIHYSIPFKETLQIEDTLNYQQVYSIINCTFKTPHKLLENVLQNICIQLFSNFEIISLIEISIFKNRYY